MEEFVEVGGIKYRRRKMEAKKNPKNTALLYMLSGGYFPVSSSGKSDLKDIDIVKEYELILNKKSNLSSNTRYWVVRQFERCYEKVK